MLTFSPLFAFRDVLRSRDGYSPDLKLVSESLDDFGVRKTD